MPDTKPTLMRRADNIFARVLLALVCLTPLLPLVGATIFDNSANNQHTTFSIGGIESGDEIQLAGTARFLTDFSFRYFLFVNQPEPHVSARVRLYLNDGPPADFDTFPTPGTVHYDSDWLPVAPTFTGSLSFTAGAQLPAGGLFLPSSDITWSIAYLGLGSGESAGVFVYSPPAVGEDPPYSWANLDGVGWYRQTAPHGGASDFEAVMQASEVPEPSELALSLLGVIVLGRRLTKMSRL